MPPPSHPCSPTLIPKACRRARRGTGESQKASVLWGSFHARREQMCWHLLAVKRAGKQEAGLQGCQEPAAAVNELHLQPQMSQSIWLPAAELWGAHSICTLLLLFLAPKLPLEVVVREGYFLSQARPLVLTSYISRVYFCSWVCCSTALIYAHTGGGKSI